MKKVLLFIVLALVLVGCTTPEPQKTITEVIREVEVTKIMEVLREIKVTQEVEVTRQVEVIKEIEVTRLVEPAANELGPWVIRDTITQNGQYLVPEEAQPGQWAYQADDPEDTCWAVTYSDLSGENNSVLDIYLSVNKGFFILKENVRMVAFQFGPCTWTRIGD